MSGPTKPIEEFFLESLLRLCLFSILTVMAVDFFFTGFAIVLSIIIDCSILLAITSAFVLYKQGYFRVAVLLMAFIIMAAMFYQSIMANTITTSSMAVIMVIGFGFSVLLKGRLPIFLHGITISGMIVIFVWQAMHPLRYGKPDANDIVVACVTYLALYIIIAYSSRFLKNRYDFAIENLASINLELIEKSNEIETQNEELVQSQENLYNLNTHLESLVHDRTKEVQRQNERLIRYAYSNAHHVRGPVARILGLIQLSKLEIHLDYPFLFKKIEEQTNEIDEVVKGINKELENEQ